MMHRTVEVLDRSDAERRYASICERIHDLEEFKRRGATYDLDAEDAATYDALRDLEFLLELD